MAEYKTFSAQIEVDDAVFCCPYCGAKIGQVNIAFARYFPDGPRVMFGFGGCCKAADDVLFELPADTALSYATLPGVLDNVIEMLQAVKAEAEGGVESAGHRV
jgi:hypothetical protein